VVAKGGAAKGEFTAALARREEILRQKQHALHRAQEALEEAQAREAETTEAAQAAQATYTRAEEQHVRVMEMRATHLILSAAAQEYEAARAAKEDADRALRAAKGEVKGAMREVALAKAALESPDSADSQKRAKAAPPVSAAAEPAAAAPVSAAAEPAAVAPVSPAAEPVAVAPANKSGNGAAASAKPAPEPEPVRSTAPAPSPRPEPKPAAAVEPKTAGSGRMNLILGGAAVILSAGVGAAVISMLHHPVPAGAAKTAIAPAAAVSAAAPADPTAKAVKAAMAIAGKWAPQGLSCDTPVVIAVTGGALSMTVAGASPSTATIGPSPEPGVINATAEDGGKYVYKLGQDNSLSMVDPTHQTMKMAKCAA
jgi:hypothetical protein